MVAFYLFFLKIDILFDRINSGVAARWPGEKKSTEIPEESNTSGDIYGHPVIPCRFPTSGEIVIALHPGEEVQKYFPVKFSQSTGSLGLNVSNH